MHSKPTAAPMKGCSWSVCPKERPWAALLHSTQDQGSVESALPTLLAAEGSLVPPRLLHAHGGPLICWPSKFRSVVASLSTTGPPRFWAAPRLSWWPCRDLIPPWPVPPLKSESRSWSGNICITPLPGPMFSPVIQFSFWSIQLGNFSGRGNGTFGEGFSPAPYNQHEPCCACLLLPQPQSDHSIHVLQESWCFSSCPSPAPGTSLNSSSAHWQHLTAAYASTSTTMATQGVWGQRKT